MNCVSHHSNNVNNYKYLTERVNQTELNKNIVHKTIGWRVIIFMHGHLVLSTTKTYWVFPSVTYLLLMLGYHLVDNTTNLETAFYI